MQQWLTFMQAHPILFGILAVLIVLFFALERLRSGKTISPQLLGAFVSREKALVIDLRDTRDFNAGHISGSRNIPMLKLPEHLEELRALNVPVVMVCELGQTASAAVQQVGNSNLYRLEGGINNWRASGLPLVKT